MKKTKIIPIFVPHVGCKHSCSFCNQKKITGVSGSVRARDVLDIVENCISSIDRDLYDVYIAFYGGSFTGIDRQLLVELLDAAEWCVKKYNLCGIRCSTRPDYIDDEVMELITSYSFDTVELGAQSMDDNVLRLANRGHKAEDVIRAVNVIRKYNIRVGIQTMIGLPGEDEASMQFTKQQVISLNPDFVRIYPVLVIEKTELANMYEKGEYQPIDLKSAIAKVKSLYVDYTNNGIYVLKIGLHSSESLNNSDTVLAGPWHPAFHEKVLSAIYLDDMKKAIAEFVVSEYKNVVIVVKNEKLSQYLGEKRENVELLSKQIGEVEFSIIARSSVGKVKNKIKNIEKIKFIEL